MPARSIESFNPAAMKAAREAAGWTMRQLAEKLGQKHPTAIWLYESGKGKPSEKTLNKLARALRVPAEKLTGSNGAAVAIKSAAAPAPVTPEVRAAVDFLRRVAQMLVEKNAVYGDTAANPRRVFSKSNAVEQLLVRIDDKLSRIGNRGFTADTDEDTLLDLVGYLALLAAVRRSGGTA